MENTMINSQSAAAVNSASKSIVNALEKSLKKINKVENSDNPMFSGRIKVKEAVSIVVWAGRCYDAETKTYSFSGTFTLESKNYRDEYTNDVDCLVGVTSTDRLSDDQCIALIIDEFKKKLAYWMGSEYEILSRNAYILDYCYFGGAKKEAPELEEAPSLEEAPELEEDYTIEEVCDGFYEIVFNDEEDNDITEEGYSMRGLEYLTETMPVVPVDAIVEGVNEYFSDCYAVARNRCMGFYECGFEEFCDIVWSYVWPNVMTDEALEAETRYYMEFNDRLRYMLDNGELGALYIYNNGFVRSRFDEEVDLSA